MSHKDLLNSTSSPSGKELDFSMILASSVHEMKNSLGMLLSSLDELRTEHADTLNHSKRFNTLQYEAERIHSDLIQLLAIYQQGQDQLTLCIEEHWVPDFLAERLARHTPLLEGMGLDYSIDSDDISGFFDADLLAGALNDILNNSIRYAGSKIRLSARQQSGYLVIAVEDDGPGYPRSMIEETEFTPGALNFKSGSTHLGLYFASSIAKQHQHGDKQGEIVLSNGGSYGGGVFEFWLP